MRSKVRLSLAVLALLGACGLAACIGPKHDDPDSPAALEDTGTSEDTSATVDPDGGLVLDATSGDTGSIGADTEPPSGDTSCSDAGDAGDAACTSDAGDASTDGGDASSDGHSSDAGDAPDDALGGD